MCFKNSSSGHNQTHYLKMNVTGLSFADEIYFAYRQAFFQAYEEPYDYDYYFLKDRMDRAIRTGNLKVLVTGLSYARNAIDDTKIDGCYNLSSSSQDIFYAFEMNKIVLKCCTEARYSLIGLHYYSLHYDLSLGTSEASRLGISRIMYPLTNKSHNYSDKLVSVKRNLYELIKQAKQKSAGTLVDLYDRIQKDFKTEYGMRYFNERISWKKLYGVDVFKELAPEQIAQLVHHRVMEHNRLLKYQDTYFENIKILKEFVQYLNMQNVKPLFVLFPCCKRYNEMFSEELKDRFYQGLAQLDQGTFELWDYSECPFFEERDFVDPDHLNEFGRAKMTELIRRRILMLDKLWKAEEVG